MPGSKLRCTKRPRGLAAATEAVMMALRLQCSDCFQTISTRKPLQSLILLPSSVAGHSCTRPCRRGSSEKQSGLQRNLHRQALPDYAAHRSTGFSARHPHSPTKRLRRESVAPYVANVLRLTPKAPAGHAQRVVGVLAAQAQPLAALALHSFLAPLPRQPLQLGHAGPGMRDRKATDQVRRLQSRRHGGSPFPATKKTLSMRVAGHCRRRGQPPLPWCSPSGTHSAGGSRALEKSLLVRTSLLTRHGAMPIPRPGPRTATGALRLHRSQGIE